MSEKNREYPLPETPAFDISEAHKENSKETTDMPIVKSPRESMDEMDEVCSRLRETLMRLTKN